MTPEEIQTLTSILTNEPKAAGPMYDASAAWLILESERIAELLLKPIDEFIISARLFNCLRNYGLETLGVIIEYSETELLKMRHFGKVSLAELNALLRELGLRLAPDTEASRKRPGPPLGGSAGL
jgi:DNA-directed RNA polymerase alpha subunit